MFFEFLSVLCFLGLSLFTLLGRPANLLLALALDGVSLCLLLLLLRCVSLGALALFLAPLGRSTSCGACPRVMVKPTLSCRSLARGNSLASLGRSRAVLARLEPLLVAVADPRQQTRGSAILVMRTARHLSAQAGLWPTTPP